MPYVTTSELRNYLNISGTDHDSVLSQLVNSASERVDLYTHRVKGTLGSGFLTHSNTNEIHWIDNQDKLVVEEWPIQSVQSLTHNGDELTEDTDFFLDSKAGILTFIPNSDPSAKEELTGRIELDYVAGFSSVPEQVKTACLRVGAYHFARKGMEGLGAQLISDFQETSRRPELRRILAEELNEFVLRL